MCESVCERELEKKKEPVRTNVMGVCVRVVELHGEQQPYCTCVGSYCLSWVDSPILH